MIDGDQESSFETTKLDVNSGMKKVHPSSLDHQRIAVILPCYNEAAAIADVISSFRTCLLYTSPSPRDA